MIGKRFSRGGATWQGKIYGCLLSTYDTQKASTHWVPVCKWEFLTLAVLWALGRGYCLLNYGGFKGAAL